MNNNMIVYMNVALFGITAVVFIIMTRKAKMKEDRAFALKQKAKLQRRFAKYYNNIIIRGPFRRVVQMYSTLSCYDAATVQEESVKLFEKNVIVAVLPSIIGLVLMRDAILFIILLGLGYVYYNSVIEKENDKIYVKLMQESSMTFSSCREKYMETDNIPLAILYADKSKLLEAPLNNIYRILMDTDGAKRLEEFQHSYPIPIMKTFANTCYIVNENGAAKSENGADSFAEDMLILRQECDAEVRRITKQKIAFNSLQMLTLAGLVVMPAAEMYLLNMIPGTASLLKGFYGVAIHTAIGLATIYAYSYIARSCRPSVVNQIDKVTFIDNLSRVRWFRRFVDNIKPKSFKKISNLNKLINDSLSAKDIQYIYTEKPIYALGGFLFAMIVLLFGTISVRSSFYNNYNSLSFIPQTVTETQKNQIIRMDNDFLMIPQDIYALEYSKEAGDEQLLKYVEGHVSGISSSEAAEQVKRMRTKYEGYHAATYGWWWWVAAYGVGILCWFIPEFSLSQRKKLVEYEATNDVAQLQTMMIVLSETKMDVYKAIAWLEKQATVHKAAIRQCHYSYIANPIKALDELERISPINDFKRLVRKLKSAVYTLSLHDAFSDTALDKAQSLTITEMLRGEELEQRKNSAKMIAIIPAGIALVGCFIGPVLILGITEMLETFASLGSL